MKRRLFCLGSIGLLSACTSQAATNPPVSVANHLALAPAKLVLNLPPDGNEQAPYPSTGTFRVVEGDAQAGSWTIEDPGIASIDSRGLVSAIATGSTLVWLEAGKPAVRASASLEVVDRGGLGQVSLQ